MLSKMQAGEIISAVLNDPESFKRTKSSLSFLPSGLGIAGSLRNWGYVISGQDPTEEKIANTVCTGIADATAAAITRAMAAKNSKLGFLKRATVISRVSVGVHHTATQVFTTDGKDYVFDWHATLTLSDPLLYPSGAKFEKAEGSVAYASFNGFL